MFVGSVFSINPLHFQRPTFSPPAFQADLSSKVDSANGEVDGEFQTAEISLPVFVLQSDESVSVWVILVTLASQKLPRIRPACVRRVCACMWIRAYPIFYPSLWTVQKSWWHESFMAETGSLNGRAESRETGVENQSATVEVIPHTSAYDRTVMGNIPLITCWRLKIRSWVSGLVQGCGGTMR